MRKLHYFIGQKKSPYHLSVGAVLLNRKRQILVHHLRGIRGVKDAYLLMRETLEKNESLEETVRRGLREEFGARGKIIRYLGSITSSFKNWEGAVVQKTTLYLLCRLIGTPTAVKHTEGHGSKSNAPEWKSKKFLVLQMRRQGRVLKRSDFDESEILRRI